jgi:hypothetical protein
VQRANTASRCHQKVIYFRAFKLLDSARSSSSRIEVKAFAYGILSGTAAVIVSLAAVYSALTHLWPARLAPPAMSPLLSLDLKLRYLRENPTLDPHILAVGSSITWRQLDGAAFEPMASGPHRLVNGAAGDLKIHQTRELVNFYLEHYRNVRTVLVLAGPPDFEDCSSEPSRLVDHDDAAAYAFGGWPAPYFYLRYFAPARYAQAVWNLPAEQTALTGGNYLDRYGSGPLQVPEAMKRGLRYGLVEWDWTCVDLLIKLSRELTARWRQLVIVLPPIHPEYRRVFPSVVERLREIAVHVEAATKSDRTQIVPLLDHPDFAEHDFFDAVHLQWSSVKRLSELIARSIRVPADRRRQGLTEDRCRSGKLSRV